jgi:hypothetical protein
VAFLEVVFPRLYGWTTSSCALALYNAQALHCVDVHSSTTARALQKPHTASSLDLWCLNPFFQLLRWQVHVRLAVWTFHRWASDNAGLLGGTVCMISLQDVPRLDRDGQVINTAK